MHKPLSLLLVGLFSTLGAGAVLAHGLWTEQRRGHVEVIYGHGAEDDAYKAEKIRGAWAYAQSGQLIPVTVERLADHARLAPLKPPAVLAVELDNGAWSQTADGQWVNQGRRQVAGATKALHTYKYSLAIHAEGAHLPALDKLRLKIVPQTDPLRVGVGKPLAVQVLLDGKPAVGVELIGDYRSAPHTVSATTDADGRAAVIVRNAGLNIIAAERYAAVKGDPDIDEEGFFSSLTFVGEAHHE
ncbi:DUF4198 domain-containing protein [Pseudomonas sp. UL073]|uniref:DUF4198 domain-containing protein n=1 Tax=Zestomonas insulae TaxID=2809017 RepID=A0ABS2IC61_9GAMM|nr:DUF4198 domain-containing protein [Pseudomonas insulae]MBM7060711.1 DUF4198 domain-containing protein [Pseudomonas insulae]